MEYPGDIRKGACILSLGKNTAYHLANSGQFKTVRVGSAIRISKKSFDEWLDQNLGE
ncbi:MAG: helix-turn-helix domain-containing protein [Clostridia bacterium]|nr:helix-turn-helix domain-containing protein [Clostridia bacterium]